MLIVNGGFSHLMIPFMPAHGELWLRHYTSYTQTHTEASLIGVIQQAAAIAVTAKVGYTEQMTTIWQLTFQAKAIMNCDAPPRYNLQQQRLLH
jgi:hypothetical protein